MEPNKITLTAHGKPKEDCPKCKGTGFYTWQHNDKKREAPCDYCIEDHTHTLDFDEAVSKGAEALADWTICGINEAREMTKVILKALLQEDKTK